MKKVLIFRSPKKLNITVPNIKLNNFILSPKTAVTSLGIEINENLSCNKEIEILAKRISRRNGILLQKTPLKKPLFSNQKQYKKCFSKMFYCYREHTRSIFRSSKTTRYYPIQYFKALQ